MASLLPFFTTLFTLIFLLITPTTSLPFLSPTEQESLYRVLDSINSAIPWRSLFPDDLCFNGPDGVICDYFTDSNGTSTIHVTQLNLGFISDYSPNPPCTSNSTFSPSLTSFTNLRKLFFYKCFTHETQISLPSFLSNLSSSLEELVFIENPSLFGSLNGIISNFIHLRRLVFSGTNVSGALPDEIANSVELEQISLTRNRFNGEVPSSIGKLKKLRVLDLSFNGFEGNLPDSIGSMTQLLKLDLSSNRFTGRIPESFEGLKRLVFLDLSYNGFVNGGIPLCLAEMTSLKEVYLSGNRLGGQIPEIWENLGGILGLGLSGMGLVGKIPSSMGVYLRNVSYLELDDNKLEGTVPEEFGKLLGRGRLKLEGNNDLKFCNKHKNSHHVLSSSGSGGRARAEHSTSFPSLFGFCFVLVFCFICC